MNIKNWSQDDFIQEVLEESERLMSEPVKKKEKPKKDLNKILINYVGVFSRDILGIMNCSNFFVKLL